LKTESRYHSYATMNLSFNANHDELSPTPISEFQTPLRITKAMIYYKNLKILPKTENNNLLYMA